MLVVQKQTANCGDPCKNKLGLGPIVRSPCNQTLWQLQMLLFHKWSNSVVFSWTVFPGRLAAHGVVYRFAYPHPPGYWVNMSDQKFSEASVYIETTYFFLKYANFTALFKVSCSSSKTTSCIVPKESLERENDFNPLFFLFHSPCIPFLTHQPVVQLCCGS